MALLKSPTSVFISITYKCNLKCRHCAVYSDKTTYLELDTKTWLEFFKELADLQVFRIRLSGGEPFMRNDIWLLIDALHKLPFRLSINTNATLIDKPAAEKLSQYHKIDEIMVSLDGSGPKTHDALRGDGAFRQMHAGIENMLACSLPVSLYCSVNINNFKEIDQIAALASDWKVMGIKFNDLLPEGRGLKNYKELSLNKEEWKKTLDSLKRLIKIYGSFISGTILDQGEIYDSMESMEIEDCKKTPSNFLSGCGALISECAVRPDGWITPCDRLPDLKAGNVREGRFADIWISSDVFNNFRKRRKILLDDLEECHGCRYQSFCTGGCPAAPNALYGKIFTRDPLGCYRIFSNQEAFHVI